MAVQRARSHTELPCWDAWNRTSACFICSNRVLTAMVLLLLVKIIIWSFTRRHLHLILRVGESNRSWPRHTDSIQKLHLIRIRCLSRHLGKALLLTIRQCSVGLHVVSQSLTILKYFLHSCNSGRAGPESAKSSNTRRLRCELRMSSTDQCHIHPGRHSSLEISSGGSGIDSVAYANVTCDYGTNSSYSTFGIEIKLWD